jgi:mannosyltransferase
MLRRGEHMINTPKPSWIFFCGIFAVLMLATALRFYRLSEPYLWFDEAFSILLSRHTPAQIFSITARDIHPPLYYVSLHYWIEWWGDSKFAVRSMSVMFGVGNVALIIWLTRLASNRNAALLAGSLVALLPLALRYSQETRMYVLTAFFLLGATLALFYWVKAPNRLRYLVIYTLLISAGFYTHYISFACVLSHWLYLLLLGQRQEGTQHYLLRPSWWLANVFIVVLYIPWLYSIQDLVAHFDTFVGEGVLDWIRPVSLSRLPSAFWMTLTARTGKDAGWPFYILLPIVFFLMALRVAYREQRPGFFQMGLVIYTLLPLFVVFLISLIKPMFVERYLFFALTCLPILVALIVDSLRLRVLQFFVVLSVVALQLNGSVTLYGREDEYDGNRQNSLFALEPLADEIARRSMPGDYILVEGSYWFLTLVYDNKTTTQPQVYYLGMPTYRASGYGTSALFSPYMDQVYLHSLSDLPDGGCRVWWVVPTNTNTIIPTDWKELLQRPFGIISLHLLVTPPSADGAPCPPAPQIRDPAFGTLPARR